LLTGNAARTGLVEQTLEKRPAPTAAGPSAEAFAQLAYTPRTLDPQEVDHLPLGHMKTEAQLIVELQDELLQ
jgi:hypothetical protein